MAISSETAERVNALVDAQHPGIRSTRNPTPTWATRSTTWGAWIVDYTTQGFVVKAPTADDEMWLDRAVEECRT